MKPERHLWRWTARILLHIVRCCTPVMMDLRHEITSTRRVLGPSLAAVLMCHIAQFIPYFRYPYIWSDVNLHVITCTNVARVSTETFVPSEPTCSTSTRINARVTYSTIMTSCVTPSGIFVGVDISLGRTARISIPRDILREIIKWQLYWMCRLRI
jgi:hypothetical protein